MTLLHQAPRCTINAPSTTLVNYTGIDSMIAWNASALRAGNKVGGGSHGLDIGQWRLFTTSGPGAVGSYVLDLCSVSTPAGTVTALGPTCSIPAGSTGPYQFTGTGINIAQGAARICIRSTPSGVPTSLGKWSWNQKRTSDNQVIMSGVTLATSLTTNSTKYLAFNDGGYQVTTRNEARPFTRNSVVSNAFGELNQDPGNGIKVKCTLLIISPSGGFYDGTVVTRTLISFTITGNGTNGVTGSDIVHTANVAPGDLALWELQCDNGLAASTCFFMGAGLSPDDNATTQLLYEAFPSANSTTYNLAEVPSNATEANGKVNLFACTIEDLNAILSGASSGWTDYANNQVGTLQLRLNGSPTGCPVVGPYTGVGGANGAVQRSDVTTQKSAVDDDLLAMQCVMSGGGLSPSNSYGLSLRMLQVPSVVPFYGGIVQSARRY